MKTMKELRQENPNYRVLYHLNYWDGALSGVCLWNGKKCYFNTIHEDTWSYMEEWSDWEKYCIENDINIHISDDNDGEILYYTDRIFAVYEAPEEEMNIIQENHDLFRKYVGTHTDYNENGYKGCGDLRPYSEHGKFYNVERKQAKIDLENWNLLGKFTYPF